MADPAVGMRQNTCIEFQGSGMFGVWYTQVYCTLQMLAAAEAGGADGAMERIVGMRPWGEEDRWLVAIVGRVLEGRSSGEEQSSVTFDRALATGGAHGGRRELVMHMGSAPGLCLTNVVLIHSLKAFGCMKNPTGN